MKTVEQKTDHRTDFLAVLERQSDFSGLRDTQLPVETLLSVVGRIMDKSINPNTYRGLKLKPVDFHHKKGVWSALTYMQETLNGDGTITVQDLYSIQAKQFRLLFHGWAEQIVGAANRDPDPYRHGFKSLFDDLWGDYQYLRGYAFGFMRVFGDAIGLLPQPDKTKDFALFLLGQKPKEK